MPPLGFDLRTRTALVCGFLALVIAASTLLRGRVRKVHLFFAAFAADIGLWYLAQFFFGYFRDSIWERFTGLLAVLLPQFALHLFLAMVPHEGNRPSRLLRVAHVLAIPLAIVVFLRWEPGSWPDWVTRVGVFLYVFALLTCGLYTLGQRGKRSPSRAAQRRVRFLVVIGALAGLASVADFAWFLRAQLPPVGAALSIVFIFVLAQALRHERLLDLYEMLARLLIATAVAFLIALMFYIVLTFLGGYNTMYLNAVLAAIVLMVLSDPLQERVEEQLQRVFFRERVDLERSVAEARRRLVHTLEVDEMGAIVMTALEQSRRATAAALYLHDRDGNGFARLASLGPRSPDRIEVATARALLDRLDRGPVVLETLERETRESRERGMGGGADEAVVAAADVLGSLRSAVVLAVRDEDRELIGLLVVADTRVRDAFSPEEISLLETIAAQIGVVVENSRLYDQMKERDRLALLGQMAAGIAHEIRNPLGAIKGAAQLLADPTPDAPVDPSSREFLGIILEEVDRLDRVVRSVLDLARPAQDMVGPVDVNAVVRRTLQVLSTERLDDDLVVDSVLDPSLPRVGIDPEQLRQVLMNLFRNAVQAMKGRGKVVVSTRVRFGRGTRSGSGAADEPFVELTVADNGPGISQKVLESIFLPFFTTKEKGTGLGLAISQRIVQGAGGRIEVRSYEGKGSTFAVILPAVTDALGTPAPGPTGKTPVRSTVAPVTPPAPESSSGLSV
ncbi:ATP-binding protein [Chondromyces apiculatus]|uniref:histidine kinase n=1 Tax=Chondromyces apiculatus DSM 436 TaxID=1192034 RepID=A0A017SUW1_9BACT|nr:ATP-binding protein [Chondromyces apiculatus]EYF00405.1 Sensor protein of zinc sigma-54-dependent two-component system [Chondromyces apiculatus DSM 436]